MSDDIRPPGPATVARKPPPVPKLDRATFDRFVAYLLDPSVGVLELRLFEAEHTRRGFIVPDRKYRGTYAGWYSDADELFGDLGKLDGVSAYIIPNPVKPYLFARAPNKLIKIKRGEGTSDADIACFRWLFIDVDPPLIEIGADGSATYRKRPDGISATGEELAFAVEVRDRILRENPDLAASAIWGRSGNGAWIYCRLPDYMPDEGRKLTDRALALLQQEYGIDCEIDQKCKNPSRLGPVPGTVKCKGFHTADRPWRRATMDSPDGRELEPVDLAEWLLVNEPEPDEGDAQAEEPDADGDGQVTSDGPTTGRRGPLTIEERARRYLAKCQPAISGQHGHDRTFAVACVVGPGFDLPPDVTFRLIWDDYNPRCVPPWSEKEVHHKVDDSYRVEPRRGWKLNAPPKRLPSADGESAGDFLVSLGASPQVPPEFEGPPKPITAALMLVPALDPIMIPSCFRRWCVDIAERVWCPLEYVVAALLVVIGALIGRRLTIRPKRHDHWTVVPNLWGAMVGPPGWLKTPALEEVTRPLNRLVAEAFEVHKAEVEDWRRRMMIAEARREAASRELKQLAKDKAATEAKLDELARHAMEGGDEAPPVARRYMTNDVTIEKLGVLLGENPNGLLVLRDELVGFLRGFDRQGHEQDRCFYLEGWNGTGPFTWDRLGRGTVHIPAVCVSLFGSIQPGPLARYLRGAICGDEADGFIPRFQVIVYPDPRGKFVNHDRWPDAKAKNEAYEVFRAIDRIDAAAKGAATDKDGGLPYVRFDDAAQEFFDAWRAELEDRVRMGTLGAVMEAHLSKYRSLMPSLALQFHLVDRAAAPALGRVPIGPAMAAAAWCELLEVHALRVYHSASEGGTEGAMLLAERIKRSVPNPFRPAEDVARKGWAGLSTAEEVWQAVGILEDRGWVKVVEVPSGDPAGRGRPKKLVYINPMVTSSNGGGS
jgi:putative DNA primase/helicase